MTMERCTAGSANRDNRTAASCVNDLVNLKATPAHAARIAIFMPSLTGGGAERGMLRIAEELAARGHEIDLLLTRVRDGHDKQVPKALQPQRLRTCSDVAARAAVARVAQWDLIARPVLLPLKSSWALRYLPALVEYLAARRPIALLSGNSWPNLTALWAKQLAVVDTRIVISEHVTLSHRVAHLRGKWRWNYLPALVHRYYPQAAAIVSVSIGVADDLSLAADLPRSSITPVYNPDVCERLRSRALEPAALMDFGDTGEPLILGIGRLHPQKDFPNLLKAVALLREAGTRVRLMILGEGAERSRLEGLARELGLDAAVRLPGFVENPLAYLARADLFVLSSRYEGLPGALIQALACGCPCVATNCPSGPDEILQGGRHGRLVPVGDSTALAAAIAGSLRGTSDREALRRRAEDFSVQRSVDQYEGLLLGSASACEPIAST